MKSTRFMTVAASIALSWGISASAITLEATPGSLSSLIAEIPAGESTLVINGAIDGRDFKALAELPASISKLDISNLLIKRVSLAAPSIEGKHEFPANELSSYLFINSPLESVTLPSSLKQIPEGFFAGSKIKNITLGGEINAIGDYAFHNCTQLQSVTLPSSVKSIGTMAFAGCSALNDIKLPNGVELNGEAIFSSTKISSLDLSKTVYVGDYALAGNSNIKETTLNPNAEYGEGVFMNSSVEHVSGVPTHIPALFFTNVKSPAMAEFLSNVVEIGPFAFAGTGVEEFALPSTLSHIEEGAFLNLYNLYAIDAEALNDNIPDVDETAFDGILTENVTLYVTEQSMPLWEEHPVWGRFMIKSGISTTVIPDNASNVLIQADGNSIRISAPGAIGEYNIYSIGGNTLLSGKTAETSIVIDSSSISERVIIVRVANENGVTTRSFVI